MFEMTFLKNQHEEYEALAQIAEMESNEKALLSEKASEKGCGEKPMTNLDFLNKNLTKLAEMLIVEIETGDQFAAYSCVKVEFGYHDGSISKIGWTTCEATAIEKELKFLASPYTEGETK